jgi:RND superfamily putative drug exporter
MFRRLGAAVVGHPRRVIGAWVVASVAILALSPQLVTFTSNNNSTFLPASYGSVQAQTAAVRYFPSVAGASGVIVVSAADGRALTGGDQEKVAGLATALAGDRIGSVSSVSTSPIYLSPDKRVQLVAVAFAGQVGEAGSNAAVPVLRERADSFLSGSGLNGAVTGNAAISVDSTTAFDHAEVVIGIATVLLIVILLGLVFRSLVISIFPIVVIGAVHQVAQAVTADLADWFHFVVGPELAPLLVVVMFGVGTDYIVFLLYRHRERCAAGDDPDDSLRFSVTRVGEVIASAAATVIAAFAALLVASLESLRTLAPGLIVGVLLMLLAALTLVPATFSLLGSRLFWPTMPKPHDPIHRTRSERIGSMVARHPVLMLAAWSAVLVGLTFGALGYTTTYNQLAELPSSTQAQRAFDTMASAFSPGYLGPTDVFVTSDTTAPLDASTISELETRLRHVDGVSVVASARFTADRGQALIEVLLVHDPYSVTAVNGVAGPIRSAAVGSVPGATVLIGGTSAQLADVRVALKHDMERIVPLALAIVAVILALLLRALVAPLYLLAGVVLSVTATLGIITLVFIHGLGFAGLDFTIPIVVYLFVMAIGTDYNILVASRLREEFDAGKSPREASRLAVVHGAPAVSAAALILAGTFASLMLTGIQLLEEIGLAVALGVLLAANVLATRIVPTLAALRGWHFWWPHRRHARPAATRSELLEPDALDPVAASEG